MPPQSQQEKQPSLDEEGYDEQERTEGNPIEKTVRHGSPTGEGGEVEEQREEQQQRTEQKKRRRRRTQSMVDKENENPERKRARIVADRRPFREQIMQRVDEEGMLASPKDMLLMLLDCIRDHHEKVAHKSDMKKKFDNSHPCSLVRTVQHIYDAVMSQLKESISKSFSERLIENTRNRKNEATIVGLEHLISQLEAEEREWMRIEEIIAGEGIDNLPETLLDKSLAEKITAIPELHPDGSMNDLVSQTLYSQTEKVDDAMIMMTHMTHFSNKIGEGARSMARKLGQDLRGAQKAQTNPQELVTNLVKKPT